MCMYVYRTGNNAVSLSAFRVLRYLILHLSIGHLRRHGERFEVVI